ncbi:MAG: tripartite tricarboxylate transporter TctB family protein [Comamonadaceae bacterium]|nr:MAG: tripartite tricarboxylate transporter TctB family protein [Comamonadaceae bacterium]
MTESASHRTPQALVGGLVLLVGLGLAFGALSIPGEAGYGGVGPNFLPWVVAGVLTLCGALILREAFTGGFRDMEPPSGAPRGWWPGLVWVSAGMLANAALITTVGFVLSCALTYLLAVQGLRRAQGQAAGVPRVLLADLLTGLAISAPVYWMFTKFLGINLPGLTGTGWI